MGCIETNFIWVTFKCTKNGRKKKCKLEVIYVYKTSGKSEKKKQTSER